MIRPLLDVSPARILLVDDERPIHASVRLRLGHDYELVSCYDPRDALERIRQERFDLCFTDLHMPHLNGFAFVERVRQVDPALGLVILSAFATEENFRQSIPLQVLDFIGKPLPDRSGFEHRLPEWIERTRLRRHEQALTAQSASLAQALAQSQLAHEVELVASESARDALLQTANLLTTVHAHLISALTQLGNRPPPEASPIFVRNLDAARRAAEAAVSVADGFFNSSYAQRDTSSAAIAPGLVHAFDIGRRLSHSEEESKTVEFSGCDPHFQARDLSGIDLLLLLVPLAALASTMAPSGSAVRVEVSPLPRLDHAIKLAGPKGWMWLNRRHAVVSAPGVRIVLRAAAPGWTPREFEDWLAGETGRFAAVAPRGLHSGLAKCRGLLGCASAGEFALLLALPV